MDSALWFGVGELCEHVTLVLVVKLVKLVKLWKLVINSMSEPPAIFGNILNSKPGGQYLKTLSEAQRTQGIDSIT